MLHDGVQRSFYERVFLISEWLTGYRRERKLFEQKLGYSPNLKEPRSFNEKMCWRKLYDRNPLLPVIVDKVRVRKYINDCLGPSGQSLLVPLILETKNPESIPFRSLPQEYIVKANHGSGMHLMVREGSCVTTEQIVRLCREWLRTSYGYLKHEWAYQKVKRRILVEQLLSDKGRPVKEYKCHMFSGRCELIQSHCSHIWDEQVDKRGAQLPTINFYTASWEKVDVRWGICSPGEEEPRPDVLDQMLGIAQVLSAQFGYLRVDFYLAPEGIRIGELTPYHLSGRGPIRPIEYDFELGSKWQLKA